MQIQLHGRPVSIVLWYFPSLEGETISMQLSSVNSQVWTFLLNVFILYHFALRSLKLNQPKQNSTVINSTGPPTVRGGKKIPS